MSSHAEEHFEAIRNYYHIIDPEGTLSEIGRAKKEAEILNDMQDHVLGVNRARHFKKLGLELLALELRKLEEKS